MNDKCLCFISKNVVSFLRFVSTCTANNMRDRWASGTFRNKKKCTWPTGNGLMSEVSAYHPIHLSRSKVVTTSVLPCLQLMRLPSWHQCLLCAQLLVTICALIGRIVLKMWDKTIYLFFYCYSSRWSVLTFNSLIFVSIVLYYEIEII